MCGVLLVLSAPWSASWAATKERDNPYIAKATQLREKFKYNDALQLLEKAAKWPSNTPEQVVTISLLEGVLRYETAQRPELAEQCFERALTISPDAQIPLDVSPKITDQLEKVRARVKASLAAKSPPPPDELEGVPISGVTSRASLGDRLSPYRVPVAIAGGGVAVVGVLSWIRAKSLEQQLRQGDPAITTREQLNATVGQGRAFETAGWILVGAGAAASIGSLLFLRPSAATPALSAVPTEGGAHVSLSWSTP
ncbi:hypothetical protein F0U62_34555 [Cystobacter fuscus]|uniref:hypothetical protein n=1 Tax=Cystobacter fuscus TaxID=43 RepID=UPI002B2E8E44|nr:hypothetical protein F0U62_34555 [Cystobacter fuscus]